MKVDQKVVDRLEALIEDGQKVAATHFSRSGGGIVYLGDHGVNSEMSHQWGTSSLNILGRVFGKDSDHYQKFNSLFPQLDDHNPVLKGLGILKAAKDDYEHGYLFRIEALVSAEVLTDALDQARVLLDASYKDPACVVAGVALETTLKRLCDQNSIPHAKFERMNQDLTKAGTYNMGMSKQITAWAHWRNKAAHGEWDQYKAEDVRDMINGVERFIAEYF